MPSPPVVERPKLETQSLKPGDPASKVIQAHRIDILNLIGYSVQLETLLEAYRKPNQLPSK